MDFLGLRCMEGIWSCKQQKMSSIYNLLRINAKIKSIRIKLFGIWLFHILKKRYIGIFLDPALACNLRCTMCYFSDEEKRRTYKGALKHDGIELIADKLFHRALKLQIGCGAEPTVYKDWIKIVELGKQKNIPYISLTTNGLLLTKEQLMQSVEKGLNEITLSAHGLTRTTYESFMVNGKFDLFLNLLNYISEVKTVYPEFKVRVNYTVNKDNIDELKYVWNVLGDGVDILQVRPIQKIGESVYNDFDLNFFFEKYDDIILPLIDECKKRNIVCIAPDKENLSALKNTKSEGKVLEDATYCYVSPRTCWKDGFDYYKDTFESYSSKHKFTGVFGRNESKDIDVSRKMNYNIN